MRCPVSSGVPSGIFEEKKIRLNNEIPTKDIKRESNKVVFVLFLVVASGLQKCALVEPN